MDTVTLGAARRSARTASSCPAASHRRAAPRSARRRWCMRGETVPAGTPLDRQPDRAVDAPARRRHDGTAGAPDRPRSRRRGSTPTCPATATPATRSAATTSTWTTGSPATGSTARARLHATAHAAARPAQPRPGRPAGRQGAGRRAPRRPLHASAAASSRIRLAPPVAAGRRVRASTSSTRARPRPRRGPWGEVGWEELTDGVLVAGQPDGAPSWFPCNDHPSDKATLPDRGRPPTPAYHVVANGDADRAAPRWRAASAGSTSSAEPMATYLATVQIGRYDGARARRPRRCASSPSCPERAAARRSRTTSAASPR